MAKCLTEVLIDPCVTALVLGESIEPTTLQNSRTSEGPFTLAQGKLSLRMPQISLYFTVLSAVMEKEHSVPARGC